MGGGPPGSFYFFQFRIINQSITSIVKSGGMGGRGGPPPGRFELTSFCSEILILINISMRGPGGNRYFLLICVV